MNEELHRKEESIYTGLAINQIITSDENSELQVVKNIKTVDMKRTVLRMNRVLNDVEFRTSM